jgi:hypothetical protein
MGAWLLAQSVLWNRKRAPLATSSQRAASEAAFYKMSGTRLSAVRYMIGT